MGEFIQLVSADGHRLDAYRSHAQEPLKGGIVVIQEIFGVNAHIRDVCDRYAADGYEAIAPALFDRVRRGVELNYDEAGVGEGRLLATEIGWDAPVVDIDAAANVLRVHGKVGAVGYCWGASWTWLAGCRLDLAGVACYYGRHIVEWLQEVPRCPVLMHFGSEDASIPLENVEKIRVAHPEASIHVYEGAGHGFNCDRRADYRPEVAALALKRTYAFFETNLK